MTVNSRSTFSSTLLILCRLPAIAVLLCYGTLTLADRAASDDESLITDARVQHRSYSFPGTEETIPYAVFVSSRVTPDSPAPVIVSLHGLGRTHDWLMGYHGFLDEAEAGGYIVVTPLGYIRRGWYGSRTVDDAIDAERSEQDVMNVLQLIQQEFNVDSNRIYLWGHSMGGAGTYHLAAKYPDIFAGLGVAAPAPPQTSSRDEILDSISHLPVIVLQGDQDDLVPVGLTRTWVAGMRQRGMQHVYIELPGADHSLFISQDAENMKKITDFFNIVRKSY